MQTITLKELLALWLDQLANRIWGMRLSRLIMRAYYKLWVNHYVISQEVEEQKAKQAVADAAHATDKAAEFQKKAMFANQKRNSI